MRKITAIMLVLCLLGTMIPVYAQSGDVKVTPNDNLNLRSRPTTRSPQLGVVPGNLEVPAIAINPTNEWIAVVFDGQAGWLFFDYVTVTSGSIDDLPIASQEFTPGDFELAAPETITLEVETLSESDLNNGLMMMALASDDIPAATMSTFYIDTVISQLMYPHYIGSDRYPNLKDIAEAVMFDISQADQSTLFNAIHYRPSIVGIDLYILRNDAFWLMVPQLQSVGEEEYIVWYLEAEDGSYQPVLWYKNHIPLPEDTSGYMYLVPEGSIQPVPVEVPLEVIANSQSLIPRVGELTTAEVAPVEGELYQALNERFRLNMSAEELAAVKPFAYEDLRPLLDQIHTNEDREQPLSQYVEPWGSSEKYAVIIQVTNPHWINFVAVSEPDSPAADVFLIGMATDNTIFLVYLGTIMDGEVASPSMIDWYFKEGLLNLNSASAAITVPGPDRWRLYTSNLEADWDYEGLVERAPQYGFPVYPTSGFLVEGGIFEWGY
ncbi:MAG: hypothetical protein JXA10_10480 [Anaerolineae bacterium]|nr:hypothetical protein [Anaerolineae bacterium]